MAIRFDSQPVCAGLKRCEVELAVGRSDGFGLRGAAGELDFGAGDGSSGSVVQDPLPGLLCGLLCGLLRSCCARQNDQEGQLREERVRIAGLKGAAQCARETKFDHHENLPLR